MCCAMRDPSASRLTPAGGVAQMARGATRQGDTFWSVKRVCKKLAKESAAVPYSHPGRQSETLASYPIVLLGLVPKPPTPMGVCRGVSRVPRTGKPAACGAVRAKSGRRWQITGSSSSVRRERRTCFCDHEPSIAWCGCCSMSHRLWPFVPGERGDGTSCKRQDVVIGPSVHAHPPRPGLTGPRPPTSAGCARSACSSRAVPAPRPANPEHGGRNLRSASGLLLVGSLRGDGRGRSQYPLAMRRPAASGQERRVRRRL